MNYKLFKRAYVTTTLLACVLGLFYTYNAVAGFLAGRHYMFFLFLIPSMMFYTLFCSSVLHCIYVFDWINAMRDYGKKINFIFDFFIFTEEEETSNNNKEAVLIGIFICGFPIILDGAYLMEYIYEKLTTSKYIYSCLDNKKIKITVEECGDE